MSVFAPTNHGLKNTCASKIGIIDEDTNQDGGKIQPALHMLLQ